MTDAPERTAVYHIRGEADVLTMTEVAEIARISEEVLRTRLGRGVGPEGGFRIGKQLVFRKGKVRAWIKAVEEAQNRQGAA